MLLPQPDAKENEIEKRVFKKTKERTMTVKTFLATTGQGLTRATCGTNEVWSVEFLVPDHDVRCLAADPLNPELLYAGTQGHGVLRSNDAGQTWQPVGLVGQTIKALASSPTQPGTLYAGTNPARLFVSRDRGTSWTELAAFRRIPSRWFWFSPAEKPFSAYVQAIALSPTDPQIIMVGIEAGVVVRSTDGGQTWSGHRRGALRDCHSLAFHVSYGDWVYEVGGSGAGVSVSRDAGATWRQPKDGLDWHYGWAGAADPVHPDVWYASVAPNAWKAHSERHAQAMIVRSMGGAAWQRLTGGLPQPLSSMPYALLTDPTAPGHVYAGLSNGEVWHSTDHGDTWRHLPLNLGSIHRTLLLLPYLLP
jgi:photosystem II stability/assembly factor-like uncharacterized protein